MALQILKFIAETSNLSPFEAYEKAYELGKKDAMKELISETEKSICEFNCKDIMPCPDNCYDCVCQVRIRDIVRLMVESAHKLEGGSNG